MQTWQSESRWCGEVNVPPWSVLTLHMEIFICASQPPVQGTGLELPMWMWRSPYSTIKSLKIPSVWRRLLTTCFVASPDVLSSLFIIQQSHLNVSRLLQWTWSTHVPKSLPFLSLNVGPCHFLYNGYNRLTWSQCYELCLCTSAQLCSFTYANCKALEQYLFYVQLGQLIQVAL